MLRVENGTAAMSTPRSTAFPVHRALGLLYPSRAGRPQDDPDLMEAQGVLAEHQKKAKALVLGAAGVKSIRWELDEDWLARHGMQPGY